MVVPMHNVVSQTNNAARQPVNRRTSPTITQQTTAVSTSSSASVSSLAASSGSRSAIGVAGPVGGGGQCVTNSIMSSGGGNLGQNGRHVYINLII